MLLYMNICMYDKNINIIGIRLNKTKQNKIAKFIYFSIYYYTIHSYLCFFINLYKN